MAETGLKQGNRELNSSLGPIPGTETVLVSRTQAASVPLPPSQDCFHQRQVRLRDRTLRREVGGRGAAPSSSAELPQDTSITICHTGQGSAI